MPRQFFGSTADCSPTADVIPLTTDEIDTLAKINAYDWASVEPSIFGTLFERTLDPSTRSQIGVSIPAARTSKPS